MTDHLCSNCGKSLHYRPPAGRYSLTEVGILVPRLNSTAHEAKRAFCRILIYARSRGAEFTIKPSELDQLVAALPGGHGALAADEKRLFDNGFRWLSGSMESALAQLNRCVPQGHRVTLVEGELVLEPHPIDFPVAESAAIIFDVDGHAHGPAHVAVQTTRLADRLGWGGGQGQRWRMLNWRYEWQNPDLWGDRGSDAIFDLADDAVGWLNAQPKMVPSGWCYRFDGDGRLVFDLVSTPTVTDPAPGLFSHPDGPVQPSSSDPAEPIDTRPLFSDRDR